MEARHLDSLRLMQGAIRLMPTSPMAHQASHNSASFLLGGCLPRCHTLDQFSKILKPRPSTLPRTLASE